jgi:hypothetical protein
MPARNALQPLAKARRGEMEHLIRLRKAWEWCKPGIVVSVPERIDLPADPTQFAQGRTRLQRRFGTPAIDPSRESLALRFENVPGLRRVRLNGQPIAQNDPKVGSFEVSLALPLPARNVLELEVDRIPPQTQEGANALWGDIALVIRPTHKRD